MFNIYKNILLSFFRDDILRSIRSNKEIVTALLADYNVQESGTTTDEIHKRVFRKYEDGQQSKYKNLFESNQLKRWAVLYVYFLK